MHLFYTPDIQTPTYLLNEEESKHCIRVLRLQVADTVYLIDGKGGFYTAIIEEANPKKCLLLITNVQKEYGKRNFHLHMAVAPTKNIERMEWFLEKATEMGIDEISPIICQRSERKEIKTERLNKIITSAVKQSIKAYHPILNEAQSFASFTQKENEALKYIAHCAETPKQELKEVYTPNANVLILIGPEGDFTPDEIKLAVNKGFIPISLGHSRLRTETAALAACFEIHFISR